MDVSIRSDEQLVSSLFLGPAIIPQIFMRLAYHSAKQEDIISFNEMIFDVNIGDVLCEKLNTKCQLCTYFHVVPQESIMSGKVDWNLLEKKEKEPKDYEKIGTELDVDTILEIDVISFGIKDPGIFSDPYAFLKIDVKMTTASGGIVIWRDIVQARTAIGMNTVDFLDTVYTDVEYLKKKLEEVADAVSEQCIEKLGFGTNNTYLLGKDYIEKSRHKINIAEKLSELNVLRHEDLITDSDYDEAKLDLIEHAKGRNIASHNTGTEQSVVEIKTLSSTK